MAAKESNAETVSQTITKKLMRRIVDKHYVVGQKLPTERELAAEFCVTRHVVREALKRLEAVGLLRIRQGSGIFVERIQFSGGVELFEVMLTNGDGSLNPDFLREAIEFRGYIIRQIVRFAAMRRTVEEMAEIRRLAMERSQFSYDNPEHLRINESLYRLIAQAAHNQIYELIFNTVGRLTFRLGLLIDMPILGPEEQQSFLLRLIDAIESKDPVLADQLMCENIATIQNTLHLVLEADKA